MASAINFEEISNLDASIDVLLSCKPLPESQIKILCDKVSHSLRLYSRDHKQRYIGSHIIFSLIMALNEIKNIRLRVF